MSIQRREARRHLYAPDGNLLAFNKYNLGSKSIPRLRADSGCPSLLGLLTTQLAEFAVVREISYFPGWVVERHKLSKLDVGSLPYVFQMNGR